MVWDYAEGNPFSKSSGNWMNNLDWIPMIVERAANVASGYVQQLDASAAIDGVKQPLISTDPPYYDNVSYADLSDFFYVWLRRALGKIYPSIFSTLVTPKAQELIATPYRFNGSNDKAKRFFEEGLGKAFAHMHAEQRLDYPMTVYYAFKQAESEDSSGRGDGPNIRASTGWETMLEGLLHAGFAVAGTWPMRTEMSNRSISIGSNALASSIVLVCRARPDNAPMATRREFIRALLSDLPGALDLLIKGTVAVSAIAPVDLAQAAIGPGMAIFSRYSQVLEASGEPMRVRTALELINQEIDRYFSAQEGEQDGPTRFCLAWYRTHGSSQGDYGQAETLSKASNVDVRHLARQALLDAAGGKVRLRPASEYPKGVWDLATAHPLTTWEAAHRLVAALARDGVQGAAALAQWLGGKAEEARELAYLLYTEATKRGWTAEAAGYNDLAVAWPEILKAVGEMQGTVQDRLL
jgi:putative DNA methylase